MQRLLVPPCSSTRLLLPITQLRCVYVSGRDWQAHAGSYDLRAVAVALQDMAKMNVKLSDEAREAVVISIVYLWRSKPETRDSHIEYVHRCSRSRHARFHLSSMHRVAA